MFWNWFVNSRNPPVTGWCRDLVKLMHPQKHIGINSGARVARLISRAAKIRAGAADCAVAIPDGDSVFGHVSAAGNGADVQQLGREVSFGNALVARSAFRVVGPVIVAGK